VTLQTTGQLPPTKAISFGFQTAMNVWALGVAAVETDVLFHVACPGIARPSGLGYRGQKIRWMSKSHCGAGY